MERIGKLNDTEISRALDALQRAMLQTCVDRAP
jgi:hypothetical protein